MKQLNFCFALLLILSSSILAQTTQTYPARGVVKQIAPDHRHATIKHEAIPGYMLAMTMDLSVRDTNGLNAISPGDVITFDLVVTADDDWVDNIKRVGSTNAPANWQLLSISFDSGFDQPQILAGYGKFYRGEDTNGWLFAVASPTTLAGLAPKVDLNFWKENGTYSHNLRTVVLDVNRRIFRQFSGNEWTPQQLADALRAAAKVPARHAQRVLP